MTGRSDTTDTDAPTPLTISAPELSRTDERIEVRIAGARPNATVDFDATLTDDDGTDWRSRATFTADDAGIVDLSSIAPAEGTWRGAEPMAWLWSMGTEADERGASLGDDSRISIDLHAESRGRETAVTIERELYDPGISRTDIDQEAFVATLFEPAGRGPAPGLLTLHGSAGRLSYYSSRLLATHGFTVLALDYVGDSDHLPDRIANIDLSYFDGAADWFLDHTAVTGDRLGLVGVSRGAEAALLLGARREWVGAVVSYAGSGVPWDTPHDDPAWLDGGAPVPHIVADDNHPNRTDLDAKPLDERLPSVERTDGPILLLSGGSDPVWDARRLSQVVVDRLDATDFSHDYAHLTYDDVGHYIGIPYVPLGGFVDASRMRPTVRASEDSWPTVLDYLESGLGEPTATSM